MAEFVGSLVAAALFLAVIGVLLYCAGWAFGLGLVAAGL